MTRWEPMKAGMLSSQFCHAPPSPCTNTMAGQVGGRSPPVSTTLTSRPSTVTRRVIDGQSTSIQVESSPSAYVSSGPGRSSPLSIAPRSC